MKHTTEGMLESVSRMIQTLEQVIEDLVPLLPHDFNVISMFQVFLYFWCCVLL